MNPIHSLALKRLVLAGLMSLSGCTAAMEQPAADVTPDQIPGWGKLDLATIPAGGFMAGSGRAEREAAYQLDEAAYGHHVTRDQGWYDQERNPEKVWLDAFVIMRAPVTQAQYAAFVKATSHAVPDVDEQTWQGYGLIHPYASTRRFAWRNGQPPADRLTHPVVLVSHQDAEEFADWLSQTTGQPWRLPSELEWEKAARGSEGNWFPWGNGFDPHQLNSHDLGPFDTTPVGAFPAGASPYGVMAMAGQVYEWTATAAAAGRYLVKGGSWDDKGCGVCRAAARHGRPEQLKHILVGFRLVRNQDK